MSFKYFSYLCNNKQKSDMKIYTSYFANGKKLGNAGIIMIGIALYPPRWFYGTTLRDVAPTYSILKQTETEEEYVARFKKEVLALRDPKMFVEQLQKISRGRDVALCCYEKPGEFCHRHLVAEWLSSSLGIEVKEFNEPKKKEESKVERFSLFNFDD